MHKYGENKMTQIMMATVRHITSRVGKFQATWFLLNCVNQKEVHAVSFHFCLCSI